MRHPTTSEPHAAAVKPAESHPTPRASVPCPAGVSRTSCGSRHCPCMCVSLFISLADAPTVRWTREQTRGGEGWAPVPQPSGKRAHRGSGWAVGGSAPRCPGKLCSNFRRGPGSLGPQFPHLQEVICGWEGLQDPFWCLVLLSSKTAPQPEGTAQSGSAHCGSRPAPPSPPQASRLSTQASVCSPAAPPRDPHRLSLDPDMGPGTVCAPWSHPFCGGHLQPFHL